MPPDSGDIERKGDWRCNHASEPEVAGARFHEGEARNAELPWFDSLSAYLREALEINICHGAPGHGRSYRTPMWDFVRRAKAHSDLARLGEFGALAAIEKCFKSWDNSSGHEDTWEKLFPDSEDPRAEFIYTWPRIKWAVAVLDLAEEAAKHLPLKPLKSCSPKYDRFISVLGHLQRNVEGAILVPCVKFARLLGCQPITISRYREFARASGLLKLTCRGIKAQRKADEFVFAVEQFDWKTGKQVPSENLNICLASPKCYTEIQENHEIERKEESQEKQEQKETQEMKRETRALIPAERKKLSVKQAPYIPTSPELARELEKTASFRTQ